MLASWMWGLFVLLRSFKRDISRVSKISGDTTDIDP
jgi:hypothetical protein